MIQIFGHINNPFQTLNSPYGDLGTNQGPIYFISNVLKFISIAGGIFAFINIILSGLQYISSAGKPEPLQQAQQRIYMSLIGLVLIVSANVLAGILGYVLFGSWTAILVPQIYGP